MSAELDDIQAIFFEECTEGLTAAEQGLTAMAEGDLGRETIAAVFRAVHSIKGGSGAFGHNDLLAFSHQFENVLDEIRADRLKPTPAVVRVLLSAFDVLADHVSAARDGRGRPDDAAVIAALEQLLIAPAPGSQMQVSHHLSPVSDDPADPFGFEPVAADVAELGFFEHSTPDWLIRFKPSRAALANGAEPLLVIRELERLGLAVVGVDSDLLPALRDIDSAEGYLSWTLRGPGNLAETDLRDCFDFVAPDSVIEIVRDWIAPELAPVELAEPPHAAPPRADSPCADQVEKRPLERADPTIRVDLGKLDGLLNLVGELVIRNSILTDRLAPEDQERAELPQLSRLTRQIQDSVMGLRAQPIRQAFNRVPRMLRDLAGETGKTVKLILTGEQTEVDKTVIERIGDPLTHLIRNAVDHGIEDKNVRLQQGKPAEGTIRLSAEQKGGKIIVRVSDDGGGIDEERVRAKALQRGLIEEDALLSPEEVQQLIFAPGFSTADNVSNISGRGVGMDVVRSNIEALGGRVEVISTPGVGTSFTLVLPLTLAILDGMIVRLDSARYVMPLASVVESVQPARSQVQAVTPDSEVMELRGQYVPVRRLADVFGLPARQRAPEDSIVIVVESDTSGPVGIMVDTIDDRREVVIKSLDQNLHPIPGLGGATVLGDGTIALILDVEAIVATLPHERAPKGMAA